MHFVLLYLVVQMSLKIVKICRQVKL